MIKKICFAIALLLCATFTTKAQNSSGFGQICLNPYVAETEPLDEQSLAMMTSKLQQIATVGGMSGAGFDNRFIITAHVQILENTQTQTIPQKNAVHMNVGIYVGDGLDGTLFSSYSCDVKGIGDTEDLAMASAIKKIRPAQQELQDAIALGKMRILDYYDHMSANIIKTASSTAAAGKYDEAVNMLFAIPMGNADYQKAQNLIAQYASKSMDNKNMDIVRKARSAWSADPSEQGAAKAGELLGDVQAPSTKVQAEVTSLQKEMATRLKAENDKEYQLRAKEQQNAHNKQMAAIQAAASVAKTFAASRPKVVYKFPWW